LGNTHSTHGGDEKHNIFIQMHDEKKMLRRPGCRTEDNIKMGMKMMRKNVTDSYCSELRPVVGV
jgi:hypothetical protein